MAGQILKQKKLFPACVPAPVTIAATWNSVILKESFGGSIKMTGKIIV